MVAIVSSTIIPQAYSYFSVDARYEQTIFTLNRLKETGFNKIYLLDNSIRSLNVNEIKNKTFDDLHILHSPQYCFPNKGLNEALLILNNLPYLPDDQFIFKISGRYYPTEKFVLDKLIGEIGNRAIAGTGSDFKDRHPYFNTRSYLVKDKQNLETILTLAIEEMMSYGRGIHGIASLFNFIKSIFVPQIGTPFQLSLEQSFARILKHRKDYVLTDKINIEGYIAGSDFSDFVSE